MPHQLHRVTSELFISSNLTQVIKLTYNKHNYLGYNTKHAHFTSVNILLISPFCVALVKNGK